MKLPDTVQRGVHLGYLAGLGAALCYAASNLIARKIVSDYSSPTVGTALSMSFGTVILAALFYRDVARDALTAPRRAWVFVALAGCAATWGVSFLFLALSQAPVVLVAPLTGISPLVAIVLTHFFLQRLERVTWRTMVGALMVVAGVILIALGRA